MGAMSAGAVGRNMPAVVSLDDLTAMIAADEHGHRYESSPDGVLSVMPPADNYHAVIATRMMLWLGAAGVLADRLMQAVGFRIPGKQGSVGGRIPDLVVWRKAQPRGVWLPVADVLLVIEMISPGSEAIDTVAKRREYASAGIPQYWTVDQDAANTVTMYRLTGEDRYEMRAATPLAWVLNTAPAEHLDA
jgi:Uma2 family endonuclease